MIDGFSDRALRRCVIVSGCLAALSFGAAMVVFPGGAYNPAMRMLSTLALGKFLYLITGELIHKVLGKHKEVGNSAKPAHHLI